MSSIKNNTALQIQKRHSNLLKTRGITKPAIDRLFDKAGITVIKKADVYPVVRSIQKQYMDKILKDATLFAQSAKRKTITREDMRESLKINGRRIYG